MHARSGCWQGLRKVCARCTLSKHHHSRYMRDGCKQKPLYPDLCQPWSGCCWCFADVLVQLTMCIPSMHCTRMECYCLHAMAGAADAVMLLLILVYRTIDMP